MFSLPIVIRPIKITGQIVPFHVLVVTNSTVLRLLAAELGESGARMSAQSAVTVCIELFFKDFVGHLSLCSVIAFWLVAHFSCYHRICSVLFL